MFGDPLTGRAPQVPQTSDVPQPAAPEPTRRPAKRTMSVRDKLVDLYYALVVRPDFRIPPETLAKTVTLRRTRACLLSKRINLVIDVGANVGQYVRQVRRLGYRGRI